MWLATIMQREETVYVVYTGRNLQDSNHEMRPHGDAYNCAGPARHFPFSAKPPLARLPKPGGNIARGDSRRPTSQQKAMV